MTTRVVCFYLAEPAVYLCILPQGRVTSALYHDIVCSDLDQLDPLQGITLAYYMDDVMLFLSNEQKVASILMPWKKHELEDEETEHIQLQGSTPSVGQHGPSKVKCKLQNLAPHMVRKEHSAQ